MAERVFIEDFSKEKAIELQDGSILNIPDRTAELYEAIVATEKKHDTLSEYDYNKIMLEALFGREGFKKIAPNGKKTNLDYLSRVTVAALELFLYEKIEAERAEMEKKAELIKPLSDRLEKLIPFADKVK